ncbi:DUF2213 domain-containing protein [Leptothoe sp. ISB3NOV94-8A]
MKSRFDTGFILKSQRLDDGRLRFYMRIGKANQLLAYQDEQMKDGVRYEIIRPQQLFHRDSIDSAKMGVITLDHPDELISPETVRQHIQGSTGHSVVIDGDFLGIVGTLFSKDAIAAVESGEYPEISPAYLTDWMDGDGTKENPYHQLPRKHNHFALVKRGRHGSEVRSYTDAVDDALVDRLLRDGEISNPLTSVVVPRKTMKITLGNKDYEVEGDDAKALSSAISSMVKDHADMKKKHMAMDGENKVLKSDMKKYKAKADSLETSPKLDAKEVQEYVASEVKDRLDCWSRILPHMDANFEPDFSASSADVKRLWIAKHRADMAADPNFQDDGFIEGAWRAIAPELSEQSRQDAADDDGEQEKISSGLKGMLAQLEKSRQDHAPSTESAIDKARADAAKQYSEAWSN